MKLNWLKGQPRIYRRALKEFETLKNKYGQRIIISEDFPAVILIEPSIVRIGKPIVLTITLKDYPFRAPDTEAVGYFISPVQEWYASTQLEEYISSLLEAIRAAEQHYNNTGSETFANKNWAIRLSTTKSIKSNFELCQQCQVNEAEYQERNLGGLFCSRDCQRESRAPLPIGKGGNPRDQLRSQKSMRYGGTAQELREMEARHQKEMSALLASIKSLDAPRQQWEVENLKKQQEYEKKNNSGNECLLKKN